MQCQQEKVMSLDYLTSKEVSKQLGVSSDTVRNWLQIGFLNAGIIPELFALSQLLKRL